MRAPQNLPYASLRARVDAVRASISRRANAECRAAGLTDAGHLHNALVSHANGSPWREVNYSRAHKAGRLFARQFDADRCLSRLYGRLGPAAFDWA